MAQFDRFTERARKVLSLALEESTRFNHHYIGTEHLLLGLIRQGDGQSALVLDQMKVHPTKIRSAIEFMIGRGDAVIAGEPGLTPRAKKVLELAIDEAERRQDRHVGTEHLLLGLVREGEGRAAGVLQSLGVTLDVARATVAGFAHHATRREFGDLEFAPGPAVTDLSARTIALITRASEMAMRLKHVQVGVGHLLLALFEERETPSVHALADLAPRFPELRATIIGLLSTRIRGGAYERPLSANVDRVLRVAHAQRSVYLHRLITPEHVLLGIAIAGERYAEEFQSQLGIDIRQVQSQTRKILGVPPEEEGHAMAAV